MKHLLPILLLCACAWGFDRDPGDRISYKLVVEYKEEMFSRFDTVTARSYQDLGNRVYVALTNGRDVWPDRVECIEIYKRIDVDPFAGLGELVEPDNLEVCSADY